MILVQPKESQHEGFHFLPGSDDEDSSDNRGRPSNRHGDGTIVLRGVADGPMFILSSKTLDEDEVIFVGGHFLYESMMVLWLRKWTEYFFEKSSGPTFHDSPSPRRSVAFPIPDFDPLKDFDNSIFSFFHHMDLLLPLCLKSIVLRYSAEVLPLYPAATRVQLDRGHQSVFGRFAEMLARGLVGMCLSGLGAFDKREQALLQSISAAGTAIEFLIGLIPVFQAEDMRTIISKFFKVLKNTETEHLGLFVHEGDFEWTEESLLRVRCSRQLRLRTIESLATMPSFCSLNNPGKVSDENFEAKSTPYTWLRQHSSKEHAPLGHFDACPRYPDGLKRIPVCGWLSDLVIDEALSVCSLSSEAVVAEALAHVEVSRQEQGKQSFGVTPSLKRRPGAALQRDHLMMFQSLSIHAVTIVYELVLRRCAIDRRYQSDSSRSRLAAMFARPILDRSISSVRWLSRMESTHKVRSLWLLCFIYVLQEAPVSLIQKYIYSCCDPRNIRIHRFIRLLRISSSTFQGFVDRPKESKVSSEIDGDLTAWLLQESFNTICATTNTVVEACVGFTSRNPQEQRKVMQGLLDLLLHILTTPQSSVTHLRAMGGALQAMEQFGVDLFLEVAGDNFQHWMRVLLSLMNSPSLSVRSIAVDFAVSLLGGAFDASGNIDEIRLVLMTVLPEVVAREVALYNVSGLIQEFSDISRCLWPLRRALTDIQDANPLDDDRVDPQLSPLLRYFGRGCQAIIDGVLVEMNLFESRFLRFEEDIKVDAFDAGEESLYEAAAFFSSETSPLQRIRWLLSLKTLHEKNECWIEAAEASVLCAETIAGSLPFVKSVWRPTNFALWTDSTRSHWLDNVGEEIGKPDFGNRAVMEFANSYLEPEDFAVSTATRKSSSSGRLQQPSVGGMCELLNVQAKEATDLYLKEKGCEEIALQKLEAIQKVLIKNFDEATKSFAGRGIRGRRRQIEDEAILRRMISNIGVASSKLSDRVLARTVDPQTKNLLAEPPRVFVAVRLSGAKLKRFQETIALPPFLEWNEYCICAVPGVLEEDYDKAGPQQQTSLEEKKMDFCKRFAESLLESLERGRTDHTNSAIQLTLAPHRTSGDTAGNSDPASTTVLEVFAIDPAASMSSLQGLTLTSRRFCFRQDGGEQHMALDFTVALPFPCALSRQRSLATTDLSHPN